MAIKPQSCCRLKETFRMPFQKYLSRMLTTVGYWALSTAKKLAPNSAQEEFKNRLRHKLWFVADIPLFIDEQAVEKLHDALSRPEFETKSRKASMSSVNTNEYSNEITGSGEIGLAPFMKLSTATKLGQKRSSSTSKGAEFNQEKNNSAEMRFEKIINFYANNYPKRIFWAKTDLTEVFDTEGLALSWTDVSKLIDTPAPRPLIIFEAPIGSKIVPMAAETTDGKLKEIYKDLIKNTTNGNKIPQYSSTPGKAQKYWGSLEEHFESSVAMRAVENATKDGGRIDWIDYRLISRTGNQIIPIHLHLTPRGGYNTGTFAYQTVRRGHKHGIKIIGTLKQGEDVNVLAIYEN